ncbi:MAG TPA: response regulator [Kofleriaceae bacterium]|nr:response regulator [Kofleriaceae bacterium]
MTATLWDEFVAGSGRDAALIASALHATTDPAELGGLAHVAFRIGLSCLGIGAEPIGKLALAIERAFDRVKALDPSARKALDEAVATLHAAFVQLANPDKSGARVEDLPLAERTTALDAAVPLKTAPAAPTRFIPPVQPVPAVGSGPVAAPTGFVWTPNVEDDMVELFFDEATERIEALAGKLVEIERRPDDGELLRDVFRDLHTVKGSSAMVGLKPVNDLAHAAEDLVGQIRDAGRAVDGAVIDALLAALDGLREMLDRARQRTPITYDPAPVIARLRNPNAAVAVVQRAAPAAASVPVAADHAERARPTIRVDFEKLDRLLNLVGELVLGRDELRGAVASLSSVTAELATDRGVARRVAIVRDGNGASHGANAGNGAIDALGEELSRVERVLGEVTGDLDRGTDRLDAISGELREQVMRLRMVPVAGVFRKHVRTVRDLAGNLGKRARLELVGDETELDKLLVEALDEPLMHLVRNAVDHGLEPADARAAAGKPAEGVIKLSAAHRGNQVEIRVTDDGRGLDPGKLKARAIERGLITDDEAEAMDDRAARELIFRPGFSTAATVSEVSGRGVGMDIVRQAIVSRLKGTIDVESTPGQGSAFVLKLPLTLAIIQVVVARAGGETFAIPLDVVQRVLSVKPAEIELVGDREVVVVRGKHVPLIRLDAVLELDAGTDGDLQLVLVEQGGQSYALVCEHLLGKREIVIKSLGKLLANVPCVAGATLLGERVALILDVPAIIRRALEQPAGPRRATVRTATASSAHVLLVEDSDIVRESLRRILVDAGYIVTVAIDGQHGLELARSRRFDLISTDVVMPRMDGYELTRTLRAMPEYANTPIVMVTSMGERIDRVRGFDAGVDEYITKPHDRAQLVRVVRKLLGGGGGGGSDDARGDGDGA